MTSFIFCNPPSSKHGSGALGIRCDSLGNMFRGPLIRRAVCHLLVYGSHIPKPALGGSWACLAVVEGPSRPRAPRATAFCTSGACRSYEPWSAPGSVAGGSGSAAGADSISHEAGSSTSAADRESGPQSAADTLRAAVVDDVAAALARLGLQPGTGCELGGGLATVDVGVLVGNPPQQVIWLGGAGVLQHAAWGSVGKWLPASMSQPQHRPPHIRLVGSLAGRGWHSANMHTVCAAPHRWR